MAALLEVEREFYAAHEAEWASAHPGRFVVVKGEHLLGAFDSMEQALAAGAASFGADSFLVRKLGEQQEAVNIPALSLVYCVPRRKATRRERKIYFESIAN
jgi:hypothetical protein